MNNIWQAMREIYHRGVYPSVPNQETLTLEIDDQSGFDRYQGFCKIRVVVPNTEGDAFDLVMLPAPHSAAVAELVEEIDGEYRDHRDGKQIQLHLTVASGAVIITGLAKVIQGIIGRGQRYSDPNYKWICPRTANSLNRFAKELKRINKSSASRFDQSRARVDTVYF